MKLLPSNYKKAAFYSSSGCRLALASIATTIIYLSSLVLFTSSKSLRPITIPDINKYPSTVMSSIISAFEKLSSPPRTLLLVRHGTTEMNEAMDPWGSPGFTDKRLWDTQLSEYGTSQCKVLNKRIKNRASYKTLPGAKMFEEFSNIDLIVSSPLTRALQTAELSLDGILVDSSFEGDSEKVIPKIALPIAAERLYMSSEVGKFRDQLEDKFPDWDFSSLPTSIPISRGKESIEIDMNNSDNSLGVRQNNESNSNGTLNAAWWYQPVDINSYEEWRPSGTYAAPGEPKEFFEQRMRKLKVWLEARPEKCIVLFSHWGVIRALTGLNFDNCEVRSIKMSQLLQHPVIDD